MQEQPKAESSPLRTITMKVSWVPEVRVHATGPQGFEVHSFWWKKEAWGPLLWFIQLKQERF